MSLALDRMHIEFADAFLGWSVPTPEGLSLPPKARIKGVRLLFDLTQSEILSAANSHDKPVLIYKGRELFVRE